MGNNDLIFMAASVVGIRYLVKAEQQVSWLILIFHKRRLCSPVWLREDTGRALKRYYYGLSYHIFLLSYIKMR